jgi:dolichol-phosphate mannosyltransferase
METNDNISPLIRRRWACPSCRSPRLRQEAEAVLCEGCGTRYGVEQGVPLFLKPLSQPPAPPPALDLTVLLMTLNEGGNIGLQLDALKRIVEDMEVRHEFLVVDGGSTDGTVREAEARGARVLRQEGKGYGRGLSQGFREARGRWIVTMDADLSHPAPFMQALWRARNKGDVVVASRFVPGALYDAPWLRKVLSWILNQLFSKGLSLPVHDASSGYRLYAAEALKNLSLDGVNFEVLEEVLIKVFMNGWSLAEVPLHYASRGKGRSKARLLFFGWCLLKTFFRMWRLRSSIAAADYDERAHNSRMPLQRWWQRSRHRIVTDWAGGVQGPILDVGCGSSLILSTMPSAVGLDVLVNKLRYVARRGAPVVAGSIFQLPFTDASFDGLVCSQVIEHIPGGDGPFRELARVLKPGGRLIIGTPDYGRPWWPIIEWLYMHLHPQGYGDEHITHYDLPGLTRTLESVGFEVLDHRYILGAELNVLARRR